MTASGSLMIKNIKSLQQFSFMMSLVMCHSSHDQAR